MLLELLRNDLLFLPWIWAPSDRGIGERLASTLISFVGGYQSTKLPTSIPMVALGG